VSAENFPRGGGRKLAKNTKKVFGLFQGEEGQRKKDRKIAKKAEK